jgi:hypothetical protein
MCVRLGLVTPAKGSPQALADCRRRLRDAIGHGQKASLIALYGACPDCETPYQAENVPGCACGGKQ